MTAAKTWIYYEKEAWRLWQENGTPILLEDCEAKLLTNVTIVLGPEQTRFLTTYFPKVAPMEQKGLLTLAIEQAKDWSGDFNFISEVIYETPQKQLVAILYAPQDAVSEAQKILQKIGAKSASITSIYQQLIFDGSGITLYWHNNSQLIIAISQKGKLFYGAHFPDITTAETAYDCCRKTVAALLRQFEDLTFDHYYCKAPQLSLEAEDRFCRQLQYFSQLPWQKAQHHFQTPPSPWQNGLGQKSSSKRKLPFSAKIAAIILALCALVNLSTVIYRHYLEDQKRSRPYPTFLAVDKEVWRYSNCLNAINAALGETITLYEINVSGQEMTLYAGACDLMAIAAFGDALSASPHFLDVVITMTETFMTVREEKQQQVNFTMNLTLKRQEEL